jgi:hypothetical protein
MRFRRLKYISIYDYIPISRLSTYQNPYFIIFILLGDTTLFNYHIYFTN